MESSFNVCNFPPGSQLNVSLPPTKSQLAPTLTCLNAHANSAKHSCGPTQRKLRPKVRGLFNFRRFLQNFLKSNLHKSSNGNRLHLDSMNGKSNPRVSEGLGTSCDVDGFHIICILNPYVYLETKLVNPYPPLMRAQGRLAVFLEEGIQESI